MSALQQLHSEIHFTWTKQVSYSYFFLKLKHNEHVRVTISFLLRRTEDTAIS